MAAPHRKLLPETQGIQEDRHTRRQDGQQFRGRDPDRCRCGTLTMNVNRPWDWLANDHARCG